jgi:hypothetical protein
LLGLLIWLLLGGARQAAAAMVAAAASTRTLLLYVWLLLGGRLGIHAGPSQLGGGQLGLQPVTLQPAAAPHRCHRQERRHMKQQQRCFCYKINDDHQTQGGHRGRRVDLQGAEGGVG